MPCRILHRMAKNSTSCGQVEEIHKPCLYSSLIKQLSVWTLAVKLRPGMLVVFFRSVDFCAHGQGTILKETLLSVTLKRLGTHFCGFLSQSVRRVLVVMLTWISLKQQSKLLTQNLRQITSHWVQRMVDSWLPLSVPLMSGWYRRRWCRTLTRCWRISRSSIRPKRWRRAGQRSP